jgi:hypothetical protein
MYSTCLFCNASLGANQRVEHFPVGGRLAFDASKGRLWVVCAQCTRWNLTPIEERHEAIEECERLFRGTYARVSTDNIGFTRLRDGLELVRIGRPLRPEFAAWRYSGEFFSRRHRSYLVAGATVAAGGAASAAIGAFLGPAALAAGAVSLVVIPGVTTVMAAIPLFGVALARDYLTFERVVTRVSRDGHPMTIRAKHLQSIHLAMIAGGEPSLDVQHDSGHVTLTGTMATHVMTVLLANTNRRGASRRVVQTAVDHIQTSGTAEGFLETASRRNGWRHRTVSILNRYRDLGAMNLSATERLALEMSVHEETERRVMHGELSLLGDAWRDAEEIAHICDNELTS